DVLEIGSGEPPLGIWRQQSIERVFHVLGGKGAAAVKLHALAQMEAEARLVGKGFPALRQHFFDTAVGFHLGEALVDVFEDITGDDFGDSDWIDLCRIANDIDAQHLRLNRSSKGNDASQKESGAGNERLA